MAIMSAKRPSTIALPAVLGNGYIRADLHDLLVLHQDDLLFW